MHGNHYAFQTQNEQIVDFLSNNLLFIGMDNCNEGLINTIVFPDFVKAWTVFILMHSIINHLLKAYPTPATE
jgi:hypothetical protein